MEKSEPKRSSGFTLTEVLVALGIIAVISGIVLFSFPGETSRLRGDARRLAGLMRSLHSQAILQKRYFRLALDLSEQKYWVDSSEIPFVVEWVPERAENKPEAPEIPAAPEEGPENLLPPARMSSGIRIKDVYVLHAEAPQTEGVVYSYFLPNGWAEPLVLNLNNVSETQSISLELNPVTGESNLRSSYFQPPFHGAGPGAEEPESP